MIEKGTRGLYIACVVGLTVMAVMDKDVTPLAVIVLALLAVWMAAAQYFTQYLHEVYTKELDRRFVEREKDFQALVYVGYSLGVYDDYEDRLIEIISKSDERIKAHDTKEVQ